MRINPNNVVSTSAITSSALEEKIDRVRLIAGGKTVSESDAYVDGSMFYYTFDSTFTLEDGDVIIVEVDFTDDVTDNDTFEFMLDNETNVTDANSASFMDVEYADSREDVSASDFAGIADGCLIKVE